MFFWRITRLKEQLAERPLSTGEELPYLVAYLVLSTLAMYIPYGDAEIPAAVDGIVVTAIAVAGTVYVYRQNGGGDAPFFLQRYFSIGWVVLVRFAAAMIGLYVSYAAALIGLAGVEYPERTPWYETLFLWFAQLVFYYRFGVHTRDVSRRVAAV